MSKLVFSNLISLDGYCAGPGGDLGDLPMGATFYKYNLDLLRPAGTLLFGRVTFEMFRSYWPEVGTDLSTDHTLREIAALCAKLNRVVVSDTLALAQDSPWSNTEVVSRACSHERIHELKGSAQHDVISLGSHVLMNDLLQDGLVNESDCWLALSCWEAACASSRQAWRRH